ncbi:hypothetical protein LF63_0102615 [Oleiagrimonas soli]|nr:hypothetical protein [Oleiagrimonas soli]KGI78845.1 hypothetical protein LF63_0102615 [Oleiagrimonas soli]
MGAAMLQVTAATAAPAADDFDALVVQIKKTSATPPQSAYSTELQKSVNAGSIHRLEQACASKHAGDAVETFTLLGVMRLDGALKSPDALPDNAFTKCMADSIGTVSFPLPPGNGNGWPVAIQFDGKSGRVLYMAGDKAHGMYLPRQRTASGRSWAYTPVPILPANLRKACEMSVWVTVGVHGRVQEVDKDNSTCVPKVDKAIMEAAHQWLYVDAKGSAATEPRDLRISFGIRNNRVWVKL